MTCRTAEEWLAAEAWAVAKFCDETGDDPGNVTAISPRTSRFVPPGTVYVMRVEYIPSPGLPWPSSDDLWKFLHPALAGRIGK